jgi:hypothetical protein
VKFPPSVDVDLTDAISSHFLNELFGSGSVRGRDKLPDLNTLEDAVELLRFLFKISFLYSIFNDLLRRSKNILVLTGAGVSVSCGIPGINETCLFVYSALKHFRFSKFRWNLFASSQRFSRTAQSTFDVRHQFF